MNHRGTTALITGASSGLGAEFASQLAARGANLVLVARRKERLDEAAATLRTAFGLDVATYEQDLSVPGAGRTLADQLTADGHQIDTLVNNAGVGTHGGFAGEDPEALTAEVTLNVTAVVELTRALLPGMLARDRGALVNVASTSAYQPTPSMAVYGASKAFVLSFTEALAYENRHANLRILAVSPGPMRTEFFDVLGTTRPGIGHWQTPGSVVTSVLRTLDRWCPPPSVIPGPVNSLPINAARFAPRRLVLAFTGKVLGA